MPAVRKDIEDFRAQIELKIAGGQTHNEIRGWLQSQGVRISKNTFSTRCSAWGASRRRIIPDSEPALVAAVETAFCTTQHDDGTIALHITAQGLYTTQAQVKRIRLAHKWRRRAYNDDQLANSREETFKFVAEALQQGVVRCYGRRFLHTYLRVEFHHNAREDDVRDALKALDAVAVESRLKGSDKRQKGGEYITPGPDWLWCCDGHDKFRNYGVEIYAAVDAYSRRIQWCYVGNSNRRAIGILRQAVTTFKAYNRCPSFFRSDRGKEVLLLADTQYNFYIRHRRALGTCPEDEDTLNLRECYMFGTSTANVKIESLWMRMLRHQTRPWLVSPVKIEAVFLFLLILAPLTFSSSRSSLPFYRPMGSTKATL